MTSLFLNIDKLQTGTDASGMSGDRTNELHGILPRSGRANATHAPWSVYRRSVRAATARVAVDVAATMYNLLDEERARREDDAAG